MSEPEPTLSDALLHAAQKRKQKIGALEPIAALNRVRMTELGGPWEQREPLVDIRIFCPDVLVTERVCPYLRRTVAEMLNRAQASLPAGYRLRVGTALRTHSMQKRGWDNYYTKMQEEKPHWPRSALRRATNRYHAPYDVKAPPGHCTGSAVDVGLDDPEGNPLDMIAPTQGWDAAYTWSEKIGPEAKRNRMMMVEAMLGAGFSNCREEYWHYSWGDSAWAVRVGETTCPYGWAHPPVAVEPNFTPFGIPVAMERGEQGRVLNAESVCTIPDTTENWQVNLLWANGVPVNLQVCLPEPLRQGTLFQCTDGENWEPLAGAIPTEDGFRLHFVPETDRFLFANAVPQPTPKSLP